MQKRIDKFLKKVKNDQGSSLSPVASASGIQPALRLEDGGEPSSVPTSATREKIGLFELSKNAEKETAHVVAVHGLQGDAYKTWQHENGSLWLRDFLPKDIPFACVMTFGYDSTIAFSSSVAKLEDKALELLNRLSLKRSAADDTTSKPIVFVCHSFGGIVVKKALILAHERSSDPQYKDILDNTKAIAFLGVPHKGSDSAWWATFAARALKGASLGTSTNTALVTDLRKNSTTLTNVSKQFVDRAKGLAVYSFYETQKLSGALVVDKLSACIDLPNKKLFPVDANHKTICTAPSAGSQEYNTVGMWIVELVKLAVKKSISESTQIPEQQTLSYYEVPNRRVSCFFGREDILYKLNEAFSGRSPRIAVLQGMGGQGKTQVALEYCHRKRNDPFSAIFWVNATTESAVYGSFHSISELIKSPADCFPDDKAKMAFVIRMITSWSFPWLMVFDNYDNPSDFPNIQDFFPSGHQVAILVTSRHGEARELVVDDTNFIEVPGLEEDAALMLLFEKSHISDSNANDAKQIVQRLGYHPLAITQAGAYIRKRKLPLAEFMDHYKRRKKMILENTPQISQYTKKLGDADKETSLNVFTTWELSFQQLQSEVDEDSITAKLLTLLAFFDNKDIPESFFSVYSEMSDMDREMLPRWLKFLTSDGKQWDSHLFEDQLIALKDLSLLQTSAREVDRLCHSSLHPLIKDWIRLRTDKAICQENTVVAAALVGGVLRCNYVNEDFELSLSFKHSILVHLVALEENHEEYFGLQSADIPASDMLETYLGVQSWCGLLCDGMGSYGMAEIIRKRVKVQSENSLGQEHPDMLTRMYNLAITFWNQGRWKEAEELEVQVVEIRKRVLGQEHPDTLRSMSNLAVTFESQGRWKEAEELEVQVLEITKRVLGHEHPATLTTMNNLAFTYMSVGRHEEAVALIKYVVDISIQKFGANHPHTIDAVEVLEAWTTSGTSTDNEHHSTSPTPSNPSTSTEQLSTDDSEIGLPTLPSPNLDPA